MYSATLRIVPVVVIANIVLFGCVQTRQTTENIDPVVVSYQVTENDRNIIIAALQERLRDPQSAILGQVIGGRTAAGVVTVCGYVNGRNGFGGYTGFVPFMGILGNTQDQGRQAAIAGIGDTPDGIRSQAVGLVCSRQGLQI